MSNEFVALRARARQKRDRLVADAKRPGGVAKRHKISDPVERTKKNLDRRIRSQYALTRKAAEALKAEVTT
jgi:LPS O-antigen subunit length determinant protein (WzzB/FepE family)